MIPDKREGMPGHLAFTVGGRWLEQALNDLACASRDAGWIREEKRKMQNRTSRILDNPIAIAFLKCMEHESE